MTLVRHTGTDVRAWESSVKAGTQHLIQADAMGTIVDDFVIKSRIASMSKATACHDKCLQHQFLLSATALGWRVLAAQPSMLLKWLHGRLQLVSLPVYGQRTLQIWAGHRPAIQIEESRDPFVGKDLS